MKVSLRVAVAAGAVTFAGGALALGGATAASASTGILSPSLGAPPTPPTPPNPLSGATCPTPSVSSVLTSAGLPAAAPGTTVYIKGANLSSALCSTAATLGGHTLTFTADSASQLHFAMPSGVAGGAIEVTLTDALGTVAASNTDQDFVALPAISGLSTRNPVAGVSITATGSGFSLAGLPGAAASVSYCGGADQPATIDSDASMSLPGAPLGCTGLATIQFSTNSLSFPVGAGDIAVQAASATTVPAATTPTPAASDPGTPASTPPAATASHNGSEGRATSPSSSTASDNPVAALTVSQQTPSIAPTVSAAAAGAAPATGHTVIRAPGTPQAVAEATGGTGTTQGAGASTSFGPSSLNTPAGRVVSLIAPKTLPPPVLFAAIALLLAVAALYLLTLRRDGQVLLPPIESPWFWRLGGYAIATALAVVYILTAVSVLMTLLTDWLPGAGAATLPGAGLYKATAVLLSIVLTAIAARYVYYYWCWAKSRHHFTHPDPVDPVVLAAREIPFMKFQVTTRGGAQPIVERTVQGLVDIATEYPWLAPHMSVEIITESAEEAAHLPILFGTAPLKIDALCLPASYETPNGTRLKARAMHFMVERRLAGWNAKPGRTFIVHLDEETLVTGEHLLVLVDYLTGDPRPVSQGPILYPLEWAKSPWMCRAMESLRPFGCSECARVMSNPPPPHLHGSNLVVDEEVESRIGWDFGTLDGQAYVAEDLLFGLRAYALLGKEGFGWHGATMLEQPPLSVYWAVQQRLRWVLGALQGWRAMGSRDDLRSIPDGERNRLRRAVGFRVATYSLGFPVGFAGLFFLLHPAVRQSALLSPLGIWRLFIMAAGLGWVLSYQIGLARNLRYQKVGRLDRIRQHVTLLILTPVTGLFETAGPFLALTRWLVGARQARWTPTPKTTESPVVVSPPRSPASTPRATVSPG